MRSNACAQVAVFAPCSCRFTPLFGDRFVSTLNGVELWKKACKHLQEVLHPDVYSRWIAVIEATALEGNQLILSVDNDFYQTWLEENYLPLIQSAIASVVEEPIQPVFRVNQKPVGVPEPQAAPPARAQIDAPSSRSRPAPRVDLNAKFTFDQFIVGPSNSFAHAASLAVAQAPARAYNPLFIYGGTGLGKTHLMEAIGHHVRSTSHSRICYISSEAFLNEYIDALQNRGLVAFRKKYRNTDLLLIDDIHFLASKERLQEEFFHTFNALFDARKQIVMTSDRPASEITGLEQRLVSRFEWGLVTELERPDLETRVAILRHKQQQAQVERPLADDLLMFIAQHVSSNIRRLEGALIRAISYASLTGKELTLESLQYLLRDTLEQEQQGEVTVSSIQRMVAEHYDMRLTDMTSKCRQRSIATPRQIAMYLCRRMTNNSFPNIANAFGKTHATILHAYKTIDNRMDVDPELRRSVQQISQKLGRALG
ncbi:MAG: chromosomal replication initiator protein DnaA [Lentisphaerae bacterium]|nr:chromosomal replication initiator protein DnaA [Lentisphaerota bacterium]